MGHLLAIRCGFMAFVGSERVILPDSEQSQFSLDNLYRVIADPTTTRSCTPIVIALASKANITTLLTGIGHEKLNVVHRWISFGLAWVHTIPFF
jgi:hypothetical protein